MEITDKVVAEHGLSEDEYARIKAILGREPNFLELGIFSVMWSEHCSYKSSRVHLRRLPTEGERVLQGPGENAGVVDIGGGLAVVFKMESHNHPSFIEPYQGAATGVGGIMRDIFTMGARPVASLNSLRFGSFENPRTAYLVEGVTAGIAGYGNCMGVPTVGGEVCFDDSFNGNCLVNVMTAGIVRRDAIFTGRASGAGNLVMYVGSRTGRDGIHGAVMASDVFGEGGEERRPTVQVGDPFAEKLLLEACLELFRTDYVVGIQDMGAAGLTSSSVEMAGRGGMGIEIEMDKVPRREQGMSAYEVMLSESQERMLVVVRQGAEAVVKEIFSKWDLEAEVIGRVVEGGNITILEGGRIAAEIPVAALTDEAPVYERPVVGPGSGLADRAPDDGPSFVERDFNAALLSLVGSPDISSKEWLYTQFDHMVRTDTVVSPGSDAAVVRIKGTRKALALTVDCNSRYCSLDPFKGAAHAVAEAARNLVVSGATPLALTDCLNFGNPERGEVMGQFSEAVDGIAAACNALSIPVIGGNVSFYNETSGESIQPTPTIGMVGLIDDLALHATQWFKREGDLIALIGAGAPCGLGGSEYMRVCQGAVRGRPPEIDLGLEKNVHDACLNGVRAGIIRSAHDLSAGGLAVALSECCFNPDGHLGAEVDLGAGAGMDGVEALFAESASRVLVSLDAAGRKGLEEICARAGAPVEVIGSVGTGSLKIGRLVDLDVAALYDAWAFSLERALGARC